MKTAHDPRHLRRIKVMQDLFAWDFHQKSVPELPESQKIVANLPELDNLISQAAPAWPLEKINKIDIAILRLAVYELIKENDQIPPKVVVDEAVELAKQFGAEASPGFVNGVLGKLISLQQIRI